MINRPKKSCLLNLTTFTFVIVFLYIPILLLIIYSFNDSKFISSWRGFTFKYYHLLFQNKDIINSFKNTMLIAVLSTIFSTILGFFLHLLLRIKSLKEQSFSRTNIYSSYYA